MLELEAVCAGYGRLPVLFDVSVRAGAGEIIAIIGPNGAGKSTLLKTAIGVLRPTKGSIIIDGARVTHEAPHLRVRRGLALSPEGRRVFANLTVAENLIAGEGGASKAIAAQQRDKIMGLFPILRERFHQAAGSMSGGEQQMLAIGRALMSAPKVIMIDELSLGLAPLVVGELYEALRSLADGGVGVIVVDERANKMMVAADRTYVMEKGRILFEGSHDDAQVRLAASTMLGPDFNRE